MKKKIAWLMSVVLALSPTCPVLAAQTESELDRAGKYLKEQGIMVGDNNGDMIFGNHLTRAHLAVLLARLVGNPEHLAADQSFYASQCVFTDVRTGPNPLWASAIPTGWWPDTETACMAPMIQLHLKQRARSCCGSWKYLLMAGHITPPAPRPWNWVWPLPRL